MRFSHFWVAMLTLAVIAAVPAVAIVVIEENFEDDLVPVYDGVHQTHGPPTNNNRSGTWIANQYDVSRMGFATDLNDNGQLDPGDTWFDPKDMNPDTGWQFSTVRHFNSPTYISNPPAREGNEGFLISHHQGDCEASCSNATSIRLNRAGFVRFTDAGGNPVIAGNGDTVRGRFDFVAAGGNTAIALTNDIDAMVARTADEDLNPPYSKWNIGFGQPFMPLQPDLGGWQGHAMDPYVVIQVEFIGGFNQDFFGSRIQNASSVQSASCQEGNGVNCSRSIDLVPDTDQCSWESLGAGTCGPITDENFLRGVNDNYGRYQTLELEYTVGDPTYKMWLDEVEVSIQSGRNPNIPVGQMPFQVDDVDMGLLGPVQVDGIIFGATGDRASYGSNKNGTAMFVDDICFTVNQSLSDTCTFEAGPTPLFGDANNDSQVTGGDLITVQQNFGKIGDIGMPGDANLDGLVTGADLIAVQQNFGKTQVAPVPEPASIAVLLLVGGLLVRGRLR